MVLKSIKEMSNATKLSQYEIRRRVLNGSCPHIRVGAKGTKILILSDEFIKQLEQEVYENFTIRNSTINDTDVTGYDQIRRIT